MAGAHKEQNWLMAGSLMIIAVVAVGFILVFAKSILIPFVLAVFIALMVTPLLDILVLRLKFPRPLAVTVTLLVVLIIIMILGYVVMGAVDTIIATAGQYAESFNNLIDSAIQKLTDMDINIEVDQIKTNIAKTIPAFVTIYFGKAMNIVSTFFFVAIFLAFLLVGRNPHTKWTGVAADIDQKVRKYIVTKTAISTITGIAVWAILSMFGLQMAAVFGMFAFLLNFIPSIGSIIATLLPLPIAVAQFTGHPAMIVSAVALPGLVQIIVGNVIEPKLMGAGLNLHPVTILMALSFWGLLWGIPGMFLAAPLTAIIRIVLMQVETLKPIGNLLAGQLPTAKQPQ